MSRLIARVGEAVRPFSVPQRVILCAVLFLFLPYPGGGWAVGLAALFALAWKPGWHRLFTRPGMGFLAAWGLLGLAVTVFYRNSYGFWTFVYFLLIVVFGMFVRANRSENFTQAVLALLAAVSFPACAVAAVQTIFDFSAFSDRAASTVLNPNFYGYMCELIVLACIWALFSHLKPRALFWAAIPVNLIGIALSGCRSAWAPVGAGLLLILFFKKKKRAFAIGCVIGVFIAACLLLFPMLMPRAAAFSHSRYLRFIIWAEAWRIFCAHPLFGGGFLGYQLFSVHAGEAFRVHAHDLFLDILVNFGAVGTGLLSAYCVPAAWRRAKRARIEPTALLFFAVLLATAVHGITDVPLLGSQSGPLLMLLVCL